MGSLLLLVSLLLSTSPSCATVLQDGCPCSTVVVSGAELDYPLLMSVYARLDSQPASALGKVFVHTNLSSAFLFFYPGVGWVIGPEYTTSAGWLYTPRFSAMPADSPLNCPTADCGPSEPAGCWRVYTNGSFSTDFNVSVACRPALPAPPAPPPPLPPVYWTFERGAHMFPLMFALLGGFSTLGFLVVTWRLGRQLYWHARLLRGGVTVSGSIVEPNGRRTVRTGKRTRTKFYHDVRFETGPASTAEAGRRTVAIIVTFEVDEATHYRAPPRGASRTHTPVHP